MAASPLPPERSSDAELYPADVLRVGAVLGLARTELARELGTTDDDLAEWLARADPIPEPFLDAARRLAQEARRTSRLYLSADVRRIRALSHLTQAAMARAIGVDRTTVAQWESGQRLPSGRRIDALREFERGLLERPPNPAVRDCSRCGKTYPRSLRYFHRNETAPDGLHSVCRGCRTGTGESYWLRKYGTIF
jgi:DNA-binding transcriptional regulator YiaG